MDITEKQVIEDTFQNLSSFDISDNQRYFLRSLKKFYKKTGRLSEKQFKILKEIRESAELNREIDLNMNE